MSTELSFKWKPGELAGLVVTKVLNGFSVTVKTAEVVAYLGGPLPREYDYVFKAYADVLELLAACFAWDTMQAAND